MVYFNSLTFKFKDIFSKTYKYHILRLETQGTRPVIRITEVK